MERRNRLRDLKDEERWNILVMYLKNELSNKQIGDLYNLEKRDIEEFISRLWVKFQNVREAKTLQYCSPNRSHEVLLSAHFKADDINKAFLRRISKEDEMLTDKELLFCEFLNEYGDDIKAIELSQLNVGLNKSEPTSYKEGCRIRAMYLKKKDNVRSYYYELRKRNLEILEKDGKSYIQSNLIQLIEQLSKSSDKGSLTSQLKAIEHLGRSVGAFEDKVTVETVNGDEVLDRLIERAKEAHVARKESIQVEEGTELYLEE